MMINFFKKASFMAMALTASTIMFTSCDDDDEMEEAPKKSMTYNYEFSGEYDGNHDSTFSAVLKITEIDANSSTVEVTLNNTVSGEVYNVHSHDAADPATTPNGTPYNETPNGNVFAKPATGNGGSVTISQTSTKSYTELTSSYDAFFVVHDPLQTLSTVDLTTYLVVGTFARN